MKIYIFRSQTRSNLRAFSDDRSGRKLPEKFGEWNAIGVIAADRAPPFRLPRDAIEQAINTHGFQLWRMKAT